MQAFPGLDLPNTNRFIEGARDDEVGLGAEVDAEDAIGVALEGLDVGGIAGGGACVPDAEGAVVGGGADVVGVGGPGDIGDAFGVAEEAVEDSEGLRRPYY